ncbi:uncharacterized protein TRAVEDRAFT_155650 [Trametes versicolor FP-101664 SS1]|uniref:uncharacterized protein n=1 Tax=Trametes versicolor (strain FP-101664) TaxID=717944 RepID=UPI0004621D37|nr:uncharacterized protein TRAVEDRAFT_155650 [Trametes versicolor FP-101664 SS1]EIW52878.1 hypothetical protein TRAVEDRAFT_155650 [Trametes versicolor FP-101664 SS1]
MPRANLTNIARTRALQGSAAHSTSAHTTSSARVLDDQPTVSSKAQKASKSTSRSRLKKAEHDELSDIATALTDVKTYMGGFTRPRSFRSANWHEGGPYAENGKVYESPDPLAYKPRTIYLLEGRHPSMLGHGRVDFHEKSLGMCAEAALPAIIQQANSPNAAAEFLEPMDTARWPWDGPRRRKPVRWWEDGENPQDLRRKALNEAAGSVQVEPSHRSPGKVVPAELLASRSPGVQAIHARGFHSSASTRLADDDPDSLKSRKSLPGSAWSRPPRESQDAQDHVVPTYYIERKKQRDDISQRKEEEGGLMAELNAGILSEGLAAKTRVRDEKIPVEVRLPDGTIAHPSGFEPPTPETDFHPVAAKVPSEDDPLVATLKQTWDEREFPVAPADPIVPDPEKEQEWLKRVVAGGTSVLTGVRDVNPEARVASSAKLPSLKPTSPEDRSKITTSAWDSPSQSKDNDPDSVVPPFYIERKKQRSEIAERKEEEGGLMAELNAGILSEDLAAQTRHREEKIPVEVILEDGTIAHASGFVPPTPETEFHPVASKPPDSPKLPWTEIDSVKETAPGVTTKDVGSAKKPGDARGYHTSAVARASVLPHSFSPAVQHALAKKGVTLVPQGPEPEIAARREQYLPTLAQEPFWRPLLTVTVATRPLAAAMHRLSQSFGRGLPFYSAIPADERKDFSSFNTRMRVTQMNRIQQVTDEVARRLGGAHGGLLGIRANAHERGRGVNGEGLADPLPRELRMMKIGVGEWYPFAEEVKERFLDDARRGGYNEYIEVFGVDEWGKRTDGKAWAGAQPKKGEELMEGRFADELDVD